MTTNSEQEFTLLQLTPTEVKVIFSDKLQTQLRRPIHFQPRVFQGADSLNGEWKQISLDQWCWISQPGMSWPSQSCPFGNVGRIIKPVQTVTINTDPVAFALGYALEIKKIWIQKIKDISISEYINNGTKRKHLDFNRSLDSGDYSESFRKNWMLDNPDITYNEEDWIWACEFNISPFEEKCVAIPS